MAKVTKKVLKGIVKECLVEILSEGISPSQIESVKQSKRLSGRALKEKRNRNPRPALDNITFNNAISEATTAMTSDPVMSAIFADTARTTLQEQYGAESGTSKSSSLLSRKQGDQASRAVAGNPIEDLFEGSDNWAALAFSEKVEK
jgi:hypothetical protein